MLKVDKKNQKIIIFYVLELNFFLFICHISVPFIYSSNYFIWYSVLILLSVKIKNICKSSQ